MNKIYTGVLAIVAAVALTAGSAYALFTPSVEINGITLGTTTANLLVKIGNQPNSAFTNSLTIPTENQLDKLSPGEVSDPGVFVFRNDGDVDLNLSSQLTSAGGDWSALADKIQTVTCRVEFSAWSEGMHCPDGGPTSTGWITLSQWNTSPLALSGNAAKIEAGQDALFVTNFRLPVEADNSVAGKTITNMVVTVTGTQVNP